MKLQQQYNRPTNAILYFSLPLSIHPQHIACHALAKAAGEYCEVKLNTKIVALNTVRDDGKVVAVTEDGKTIVANNAVIAAGPWTNAVLESSGLPKLNLDIWRAMGALRS
jgi:glycine/D-amino acid oxidase-like deaminating enzyme